MARLRIGSRGSQLALWQANHISALLAEKGHKVSLEIIKTTGDKITEVALSKVGTKGMFTKEIEEALADNRIDLAVHSLKDLPTELDPQFQLAAVTRRENPLDAFLSVRFDSVKALPNGARVGTSSLRRQAQMKAFRPDLEIISLRGNVDTRLRKLESGDFDAILLASAGLNRLGRTERIREVLPADLICPAVGQGALGIETRSDDHFTAEALIFLEDTDARTTTTAERALLRTLGGGCQVPIGAHAEMKDGEICLTAVVASPDGTRVIRERRTGVDPERLGSKVGETLLGRGADQILREVYGVEAVAPQQP